MCLYIITHTMVCDVRPAMYHPDKPSTHVVNPFKLLEDTCRHATIAKPGKGNVCVVHGCCRITTRSYPCGCGKTVRFNLYQPAKIPCAYTVKTGEIPERGVWRLMSYLGGIPSPDYAQEAVAEPGSSSPSEKLRVARSGLEHATARLRPMTENIVVDTHKQERDPENLLSRVGATTTMTTPLIPLREMTVPRPQCQKRNSASFEERVLATQMDLEHLREAGRHMLADYETWKQMAEKFERAECSEVPATIEESAEEEE